MQSNNKKLYVLYIYICEFQKPPMEKYYYYLNLPELGESVIVARPAAPLKGTWKSNQKCHPID